MYVITFQSSPKKSTVDTLKTDIFNMSPMHTLVKCSVFHVLLSLLVLLPSVNMVNATGQSSIPAIDQTQTIGAFTRIISLYPAHTENLIALDATEYLIGVSHGDDNPLVSNLKKFSYRDDPERFIAVKPDLVLIRPMIERSYPQLVSSLKRFGITVISIQPRDQKGIYDYWRLLGQLSDRTDQAEALIKFFTIELSHINKKVNRIPPSDRKKVFFQSIHKRMKTFSPSSIAIFCLEQAGGINIASDAKARFETNIAGYGKERILSHAGEIDIFLSQSGRMNKITTEIINTEPGFSMIKAVKNHQVYLIDEKIVSRPTPQLLDGIKEIYTLLYEE